MANKPKLTQEQKADRYDQIAEYFKSWPYSPYNNVELFALTKFLRRAINGE